MSKESVELVRAAYAAWNRGDLVAVLRHAHRDIEFVQDSRIAGAVNLVGQAAVQAWLDSFQETWSRFHIAADRIEAVANRVLVVATISATGRSSGAEVTQRVGHVITFLDRQMVRWDSYAEAADALASVGLVE